MYDKNKCEALQHPSLIPLPEFVKHINLHTLVHYRSLGSVGGIPEYYPSLHHISHIVAPCSGVLSAFCKY
tara:strand:- start:7394 stop:7603 length:210 start_codon:yes stop_codon:yes gene_type:complete